jgi:hypothetical protein
MRRSSTILARFGILIASVVLGTAVAGAAGFGVNAHIPRDSALDEVVRGKIGWVRVDFRWSLVEPERDVYDWRKYDALIDRVEERGLRVFATISSTPAWATSGSESSGVPDDPEEWQEFCYLAASRYRGRVEAWGMWNEPNLKRFWEGIQAEYIGIILLRGAAAVRAADPGSLVCGPDLAHLSNADWDDWLSRVITEAGHVLDVVTHHLYSSFGRAFEVIYDLEEKSSLPFSSPSVRKLLEDAGWWGRPFWLTETGLQSSEYSLNAQVDFYEELLEDSFGPEAAAWWVDRVFFYHLHDPPDPAPTTWGILYGLPDLIRKPAFYSYRDFIAEAVVDDAEIVAVELPAFVVPGEPVDGTAVVRNTGTTTWRNADGVRLDASFDAPGWLVEPVRIPGSMDVVPGDTVELTIRMEAPQNSSSALAATAGLYARMIRRGGRPFGDPLSAAITATDIPPPEILTHPVSTSAQEGSRVPLLVDATSDQPLRYRWRRNSVELRDGERFAGSYSPQLTVIGLDRHLEGDFDCVVSNDVGSVVTETARLTIGVSSPRRPSDRGIPSSPPPKTGFDATTP